jgi:chemotaxis protein methyltransferase CheR
VPAPPSKQPAQTGGHPQSQRDAAEAAVIARSGQQALDAGDYPQAIAAFRKCAYLGPDDVLAHFHLGLALEASGDSRAARRAFETARRALLEKDPTHIEAAIGGYATNELLRLLDTKRQVPAP